MRVLVLAVVVSAAGLVGASVRADQAPVARTTADQLARAGTQHFRLGEYAAALQSFRDAYRLTPSPDLLYDIGQCHRKLDQKQEAIDSFRSYLVDARDETQKEEVRRIIDKLEAALADERAQAQPPVTPPAAATVAPAPTATPPAVSAPLTASAATATPAREATRPWWKRPWVWGVIGGAALVAVGVGVGVGVGAHAQAPHPSYGAVRF